MADIKQLERALINADKAGDVDAARRLAAAIRELRNPNTLDYDKLQMAADYAPTVGMSGIEKFAAGGGKAIVDTGRGLGQLTGLVGQESIDESKRLDQSLMNTGAGFAGNIAGNVGMAVLPGAGLAGLGVKGAPAALKGASEVGKILLQSPANLRGVATAGSVGAGQGFIQPVASDESRLRNTVMGLGGGAAIPAAGAIAKGGKAVVEPLYQGGRDKILARALTDATGPNASSVANNMANAKVLVPGSMPTAAEVANSGGIAALQRAASAVDPEAYANRAMQQNQARVGVLDDIIGPSGRLESAIKKRADETAPLRESALENANYGTAKTNELTGRIGQKQNAIVSALQDRGKFQTMAAEQQVRADNFAPVEGMPRISGRYSANAERVPEAAMAAKDAAKIETQRRAEKDFLERQLNSLRESGYSPLNTDGLISSITAISAKPGMRASDVVTKTVGEVKDKIASLADKNGNIDANDLYTIRKEIGNTVSKFAKENQNWDKRLAAGVEQGIQKQIDEAISKAGAGDLWKQYLTKYGELSKPITQIKIAQEIADKSVRPLDQQMLPNMYARSFSDETAQGVTGMENATLQNSLDPQVLSRLTAVKDDLARSEMAKNLGRGAGSDTVQKLAMTNLMQRSGLPAAAVNLPGIGRLGNWAYDSADQKMREELAAALLDPKATSMLMKKNIPNQTQKMLADALRMSAVPALTGTAVSNSSSR